MKLIFVLVVLAFGADKFEVKTLMDVDTFSIPKTESMTIVKSTETKIVKTFRDTLVCIKTDTTFSTILDTLVDVKKVSKPVKAIPKLIAKPITKK